MRYLSACEALYLVWKCACSRSNGPFENVETYIFSHQGWIAARSAYWTTKENRETCTIFVFLLAHRKHDLRWSQKGSNLFLLIQTLPTCWAEHMFILIIIIFLLFEFIILRFHSLAPEELSDPWPLSQRTQGSNASQGSLAATISKLYSETCE